MKIVKLALAPLAVCAGAVWAYAQPAVPGGEISERAKQSVEKELAVFAEELSQRNDFDRDVAMALLRSYLQAQPDFYGAAFAFAPVEKDGKVAKSSPYVYRHGFSIETKDLIRSYDYADGSHQWYSAPVKQGTPLWSDPYFDKGGGDVWMVTYSIPVYRTHDGGGLIGVVTTDLVIPRE